MILKYLVNRLPMTYRRRWGLDTDELELIARLIKTRRAVNQQIKQKILIQMAPDYYWVLLFSIALKSLNPTEVIGLWHQSILNNPRNGKFNYLKKPLRKIFNWLDQLKWQKIYCALDCKHFEDLNVDSISTLLNRYRASKIWKSIESKEDLLQLKIEGIQCGDLIYDTYMRYGVRPTVVLKDIFLKQLIAKAINAIQASRKIFGEGKCRVFLTSYTSYIQHGIPVRVALTHGLEVYSSGNLSQFFKKLSPQDPFHTTAHWEYKKQFEGLREEIKILARDQASPLLVGRFQGTRDTSTLYMRSSAYSCSQDKIPRGVEGVVFLHDFLDSPHCYRWMLFPDFWEWALFTLSVVQECGLPFAIKPHPNQIIESSEVVKKLMRKFQGLQWLPASISNNTIFQSGIECGISCYGTILHELVYHGIPALAAGDHPHVAFDFVNTPKTIGEYEYQLRHYKDLALKPSAREDVLAFYYMHNLHPNEAIALNLEGTNIRELFASDSNKLGEFLEKNPKFPNL